MAFDCFLEIEGIRGESSDEAHRNAIELIGYSHSVTHTAGLTRGASGGFDSVADHKDFVITKSVDQTTPQLAAACSQGTRYNSAKVQVARATGDKETYWEIEMTDVYVRSISFSATEDGDLPTESVALAYSAITWTYYLFDHKTGQPRGRNQTTADLTQGT
jgi:type VI secretion system secreted protein Hcp